MYSVPSPFTMKPILLFRLTRAVERPGETRFPFLTMTDTDRVLPQLAVLCGITAISNKEIGKTYPSVINKKMRSFGLFVIRIIVSFFMAKLMVYI